jgi:hypothetical protein
MVGALRHTPARLRHTASPGRLVLILAAAAVLLAGPARAGELIRLWGQENTGMAGGQFLRIPVGARAVALGKAYSACAIDGSAAFWNPAGIMRTPGRKNFFASHSEYTAEIDLHYLSAHMRQQNFGYALTMGILRSGDILRTDEFHQEGTGQYFNANQFFMGASLARAMTDRFSIGGTVKYYQENLDEFQIKSILLDMGILYFVGKGDLRIGFSVRNFGNDLKPGGTPPPMLDGYVGSTEFQSFAAPTVGTFGAARTWNLSRNLSLLTTADFNHPGDAQESFRFGGELGLNKQLFLRTGYETSRDEGGFAAGFGVQLSSKRYLARLDYAYSDLGSFGTIHHLSLDFSPLFQRKDPEAWRRRGE